MTKISIIIPVYNTEKYLRQCLNSVVMQTLPDIEIIVINDGSTDNSQKIIEEYVTRYPQKISLINSANQGPGIARNQGINIANGEYIWFIDSDDWIYKDSAEKMYNLAREYNISMVTCGLQRRFGNIKKPSRSSGKSALVDLDTDPNYLIKEKPSIGNKLIKRSLIGELRMPNKKWEDLAFSLALVADSRKFYHLSQREYN
jgi:glycosyltransferase involved in cell wall biosynthesis